MILAIMPLTGMNFPLTDFYLIQLNIFALIAFVFTNQRFDKFIFILIGFFIAINYVSGFFFGAFDYYTLFGYMLRLTAPYLIIKVINIKLPDIFPKFALFMAIFSLPFYLIQMIDYRILLNLFPFFEQISTEIRLSVGKYNMFFHTMDINSINRNNGFLWEPGGFGYFIGLAVTLLMLKSKFKFNSKIITLILIGLTTFSTTYYIFIIILLFFTFAATFRKQKWTILFFPVLIFMVYFLFNQDFMKEKIATNLEATTEINTSARLGREQDKLGRMGNFKVEITEFIRFPAGHGINMNGRVKTLAGDIASGPCGLSHHIARWGILGIFFLFIALRKLTTYTSLRYQLKPSFFLSMSLLLFLFSNPIDRDTILTSLLFLPFISNNGVINVDSKKSKRARNMHLYQNEGADMIKHETKSPNNL
jgi:hypothetical protein